jgi:acyl-CoA reductase-like NAD-dependent aldehyde dehydrogenase
VKRTFYTAVGYTLGVSTGWYIQRRVKRTVEKVAPDQVAAEVRDRGRQVADASVQAATRARDLAVNFREATQEGVAMMRREHADLLAEFATDEAMHTGPARRLPGRGGAGSGGGFRPRR